jgi:hypothetical protein
MSSISMVSNSDSSTGCSDREKCRSKRLAESPANALLWRSLPVQEFVAEWRDSLMLNVLVLSVRENTPAILRPQSPAGFLGW